MADDPKKKKVDSWFLSLKQPWEFAHFLKIMRAEFPLKTDDEIRAATEACADEIAPSEGMEKMKSCVRARLRPKKLDYTIE